MSSKDATDAARIAMAGIPQLGDVCTPDPRRSGTPAAHRIISPEEDADLQTVRLWLLSMPVDQILRTAVDDAVKYVLDGARTFRFALTDERVDSDERSSVGTKLQYHVIQGLDLKKQPPLDTNISGVAVEIKGTTRNTWMIPREGQCEISILIKIDATQHRFACWLMRTHRAWLTGGKGNRDLKRSPRAQAVKDYALPVVPWTNLPPEPLRMLDHNSLERVFDSTVGLRRRLMELFRLLQMTVIPRGTITVVGAGLNDPMKRAREAKGELRNEDLIVLVGTWREERRAAKALGFDISDEAWVAVPLPMFHEYGVQVPPPR